VTGILGYAVPRQTSTTTLGIDPDTGDPTADTEFNPRVSVWGGSLQYSMPYLKSAVADLGLPDFFNRLIPIVEASLQTPIANTLTSGITLLLTPPATGAAAISRAARRLPDWAWQVDGLEIGLAGIWVVKLTIDAGTGEPIVLDAPIVIDRSATSSTSKTPATQNITCSTSSPKEPTSFTAASCSSAGPRCQM
jgi:hypothetical protein